MKDGKGKWDIYRVILTGNITLNILALQASLLVKKSINLYIGLKVFNNHSEIEMRYFFFGITACSISFFILSLLKFKASLHMAAISGLTVFVIGLSLHFQVSLISLISLLLFLNGLIATSRLHLKAHTSREVYIGFFIGLISPFLAFYIL